tara:strand:+ start:657 stop:1031 length:375 start_codon:yes stop_codon:yes gene_type:complete
MYIRPHRTKNPSDTPIPIPALDPVVNPPGSEVSCDTGVPVGVEGVEEASELLDREGEIGLLEIDIEEIRVLEAEKVDVPARRMMNPGLESSPVPSSNDEAASLNRKTYLALTAKLVSGTSIVHA